MAEDADGTRFKGKLEVSVATRTVTLTAELSEFVDAQVESGRYQDANEVMRAALRKLESHERKYQAQLEHVRQLVDEGDASELVEGDVFEQIRRELTCQRTPKSESSETSSVWSAGKG